MSSIDKWVNDIVTDIKLFTDDISDEAADVMKTVGKNAVKTLKSTGDYKDRSGRYRKSFRYKTERTNTGAELEIYSTMPQYTHLLEYGHVILNSGEGRFRRTITESGKGRYMARKGRGERTRAFPHWRPVEEAAVKEFEREISEIGG